MTLAPIARTGHRPPQIAGRLVAAHIDRIYQMWAEQLLGDVGIHLTEPGHHLDTDPAFVFDGAGDRALRFLLDRTWHQNTRTVVYTLHAHPVWHAALASAGAHLAIWPNGVAGIARAAARAANGDVRTRPAAPIKGAPAQVAAFLLTGMSGASVADRLNVSVKTINSHAHQIMAHCPTATAERGSRRVSALLEITNAYYTGEEA